MSVVPPQDFPEFKDKDERVWEEAKARTTGTAVRMVLSSARRIERFARIVFPSPRAVSHKAKVMLLKEAIWWGTETDQLSVVMGIVNSLKAEFGPNWKGWIPRYDAAGDRHTPVQCIDHAHGATGRSYALR